LLPCQWPTDFRPSQLQQLTQDEDAPMCAGDDHNCPQFELHRQKLLDDLDGERRTFLKSAFVATGGAAALGATPGSLISPAAAQSAAPRPGKPTYHYLPATADTVVRAAVRRAGRGVAPPNVQSRSNTDGSWGAVT
jgi:hypothetical protein